MRIVKFAAGMAVGYVLGSRAGREKYEQIVATARKAQEHPAVTQAQQKAKALLGTPAKPAVEQSADPVGLPAEPVIEQSVTPVPAAVPAASASPAPRPPRRKSAPAPVDPLA